MEVGRDDEAVDQGEEGLFEIDVEQRFGSGEFEDAAVLVEAGEAFLAQLEQVVAERFGAGAAADGEERVPAGAFGLREHFLGDMVDGVAADFASAFRAMAAADASVEQAEKVVDFGGGGDGGARIARGVLLADGDGRRDAGDFVDVGLFHALEELARVGRKRFDVAALAFGVDGVENERRFAGAGHACDDGELVVRER